MAQVSNSFLNLDMSLSAVLTPTCKYNHDRGSGIYDQSPDLVLDLVLAHLHAPPEAGLELLQLGLHVLLRLLGGGRAPLHTPLGLDTRYTYYDNTAIIIELLSH